MTSRPGVQPARHDAVLIDPELLARSADYPALQALLACTSAPAELRDRALLGLADGKRPHAVAEEIGLAPWLGMLDRKALTGDFHDQPRSHAFAEQIAPLIPTDINEQRRLIRCVRLANVFGDEATALELAETLRGDEVPRLDAFETAVTAMYLAVRSRPSLASHRLLPPRQTGDRSLIGAARCAAGWFSWILVEVLFGQEGIADPWRAGGTYLGFTLKPLTTAQSHLEAGAFYKNCVGYMAPLLLRDVSRVFELTIGDKRIGLAEVRMAGARNMFLTLNQLEGPGREPLGDLHARAVHAMLADAPPRGSLGRARRTGHVYPQGRDLTQRWRAILGDHLKGRNVGDLLPAQITKTSLELMTSRILQMYSRAGLSGVVGDQILRRF